MSDTEKNRFLTFHLGAEVYALPVLEILEIVAYLPVTPVPRAPACVRGVLNLRGRLVPVVDLRNQLGLPSEEPGPETCIVVLDLPTGPAGAIVDGVDEVADLPDDIIEEPPSISGESRDEYVIGIAKLDDGIRLILDPRKAMGLAEAEMDTALSEAC
jgi:purine-binding chemotaxis protein CheW